ncbi:MAG: hypothetical protein J6Y37_10465 [Paludibacteraceae bacterium]|nr:hypothetical protein [Paludibacteraceae bacterium]
MNFMWNYYKTVYPSGNVEVIADYFDNLQENSFWGRKRNRYACYWDTDAYNRPVEAKGKILRFSFNCRSESQRAMDVRVFNDLSGQLVVECFHSEMVRLMVALALLGPTLLCVFVVLFCHPEGGFPFLFDLLATSIFFLFMKLTVHLVFRMSYSDFKQDLDKILKKEKPIQSVSKWKWKF